MSSSSYLCIFISSFLMYANELNPLCICISQLQGITIPEDVFLPLCKSVDPYQRIMRIVPGEAKAFSTKERVPTLIMVRCL